jgi:hypothetical protein
MGPRDRLDPAVIQRMLDAHAPSFDSPQQRLAWERGYLTGLLMQLGNDDILVHRAIRDRLPD